MEYGHMLSQPTEYILSTYKHFLFSATKYHTHTLLSTLTTRCWFACSHCIIKHTQTYLPVAIQVCVWQSHVEMKGYSVAYFDHIATFEASYW